MEVSVISFSTFVSVRDCANGFLHRMVRNDYGAVLLALGKKERKEGRERERRNERKINNCECVLPSTSVHIAYLACDMNTWGAKHLY